MGSKVVLVVLLIIWLLGLIVFRPFVSTVFGLLTGVLYCTIFPVLFALIVFISAWLKAPRTQKAAAWGFYGSIGPVVFVMLLELLSSLLNQNSPDSGILFAFLPVWACICGLIGLVFGTALALNEG